MIKIVLKFARSKLYFNFSALVAFFEEGCIINGIANKIKESFTALKARLNNIVIKMRKKGLSDGKRMYFYRLICKFMPVFPKFYNLNI